MYVFIKMCEVQKIRKNCHIPRAFRMYVIFHESFYKKMGGKTPFALLSPSS